MEESLKNDYEISFLVKAPGDEGHVFEILKKYEAQIYHESSIDNINLSYPIEKQNSALFGFCYFNVQPESVENIKKEMESLDPVLRFLIVTPPIKAIEKQSKIEKSSEPDKNDSSGPKPLTNEVLEQKLEEILK